MGALQDKINAAKQAQGAGSPVSAPTRIADLKPATSTAPAPQVTPTSVIKNLATKYMNFSSNLGDVGAGALKGVASTVRGIGQLGTKIEDAASRGVEKLGGPANVFPTSDVYKPETATGAKVVDLLKPKNTGEAIGKGAEQIGEFFIPAAKVGMVEKVLSEGGKALSLAKLTPLVGETAAKVISKITGLGLKVTVRAGESGGVIALQTGGDPEAIKSAAEVGGAIPALGAVAKPVAGLAGDVVKGFAKRLAGTLSGRGSAVIDEILADPRAAMEGLTGESMNVLSKDARLLKETSVAMKAEAGKEFQRVVNNLQEIYENEVKPSGDVFDKGTEINKITDLLKEKFGIRKAGDIAAEIGEEVADKGALDFNVTRFQKPNEQSIIKNALNFVKGFREPLSPKTLEGMASTIDKMKGADSELNSVLHTITSSLRDSVAEMGAKVGYQEGADLTRKYAQAMDKLENFNKLFRSSAEDLRPGSAEVAPIGEARKGVPVILTDVEQTGIIKDLSTLFTGNQEVERDTLKRLIFGGQELVSRQAGRNVATATERASTGIAGMLKNVVSTLIPPKTVGKIVALTGLSAKKVSSFLQAFQKLDPLARGAIVELISRHNQD